LRRSRIGNLSSPYFYHLKYIDREGIGKGWVKNWRQIEYFDTLVNKRKAEGKPLVEPIPDEFALITFSK
jgi:hypothetical protein